MDRIYELLEKYFLTKDEIKEIAENKEVYCKLYNTSFAYHNYNWAIVKIGNKIYNVYYEK